MLNLASLSRLDKNIISGKSLQLAEDAQPTFLSNSFGRFLEMLKFYYLFRHIPPQPHFL